MRYDVQVNPLNPVEYLACCGVFEILSRFDASATSWWENEPGHAFWIESEIDEASILACLKETFSDWSQWRGQEEKNLNDQTLILSNDDGSEDEVNREDEESNEG